MVVMSKHVVWLAMPWVLGIGAPSGEWVPLPRTYGAAEACWTKGKGEGGVKLRVDHREVVGSGTGDYHRYRWSKAGGGQHSIQRGRVWVWLREGRRIGDTRWAAHHDTRRGRLHVKQGGVVRGIAKGPHAQGHAAEGGTAKAAN